MRLLERTPERVLYIIEFPFYVEREVDGGGRGRENADEKPPRFVIAGIYKQYPANTRRRGSPKRNMVIRAMAHIDMNDARH